MKYQLSFLRCLLAVACVFAADIISAANTQADILFSSYSVGECHPNVRIVTQGNAFEKISLDLTYGGKTYTETQDLPIDRYSSRTISLQNAVRGEKGEIVPYTIVVHAPDGDIILNHEVTFLSQNYKRMIVVEEGSGTWCSNCPRGIVAMELLKENYPDSFIGVSVHQGGSGHTDPMTCKEYADFLQQKGFVTRYPSATINREVNDIDPYVDIFNGGLYSLAVNEPSPANLELRAEYSDLYKTVSVKTEVSIDEAVTNSSYRLAYVIVEDNVHVPDDARYNQANGFGGQDIEFYGFEKYPGSVPCNEMWYQDVARSIDGYEGIEDSLPDEIVAGEVYSYNKTISIPESVLNRENIRIIALLIDTSSGIVINARQLLEQEIEHGSQVPAIYEDFSYGIMPRDYHCYDIDMLQPFSTTGFKPGDAWLIRHDETDEDYYACSTSYYSPAGKSDDWMVLPVINASANDVRLSWRGRSTNDRYRDSYQVLMSTQGAEPEDFANNAVLTVNGESGEWTDHVLSLSPKCEKVWIAFRNITDNGEMLCIDDLKAEVIDPSGVKDVWQDECHEEKVIAAYRDGGVNITGLAEGSVIKVYTTAGVCIYDREGIFSETFIPLPAGGLYLIEVMSEDNHKTYKIMI